MLGTIPPSCHHHLRDLPTFMIAPQQRDMRWVCCLEQHQQREHLQAVVATVHKIAHENVVGAGHLTACFEKLQQVVKLAMYVTADLQNGGG